MLTRILSIRVLSIPFLSLIVLLNPLRVSPPLTAQTAASNDRPVIHSSSREVLLDMVVRDKHHHAVTDLRQDEVQVYEDGVRQSIRAFHNVQGSEQLQTERAAARSKSGSPAADAEKAPALNSLRQINFVSIGMAQIAPRNLEFARESVLEFLKNDTFPNTYVTVYKLSHTLRIVQGYTSDQTALVKAVNEASKGLYTEGLSLSAEVASSSSATVQATAANIAASSLSSPAAISAAQNAVLNPLPQIVADPLWARNAASQDVSVTLGNALLTQAHMATGLRFADSL